MNVTAVTARLLNFWVDKRRHQCMKLKH